jgi:glyoxylase-like metal-dependent hydrolase (beta-lactamase superfamily II)
LGTVRWAPPEISFTSQMSLHWDNAEVQFEHHSGPTSGAMWVVLHEPQVVFVGDLVSKSQPPFLAHSDLPGWIEGLDIILGPDYRGFTVVGGRGGTVSSAVIKAQADLIRRVHDKLEKMARRESSPDATEKLIEPFLTGFKSSAARHKQYVQRLRYGLRHYYSRHYRMGSSAEE